ncbi:MAG TPA: hypothetical protein VF937_13125 [Chloroflexota bacterium]
MLLRALSIVGIVLIGAGLALLLVSPLPGASRETFAASLPGVLPGPTAAATTTVGPTVANTPTARPATLAPTATLAVRPTSPPTRTPASPPATPTPRPAAPTPTPTLPVCPTATPVRRLVVAPPPLATATPSPVIPVCRTPTPTLTSTPTPGPRAARGAGTLLGIAAVNLFPPVWFAQPELGSHLAFDLAYPSQMAVGTSDVITLNIVRSADGGVVATTQTPNLVDLAATPVPFGTPGASILEARGENYDVFAAAAVSSSDLDIVRTSPLSDEQQLDQQTSRWSWSVNPRTAGANRRAQLVIELRYRPRSGSQGIPYARTVWEPPMVIDVREKDALVMGPLQIPTASVGTTLVQAGISSQVPLLIAWIRGKLSGGSAKGPRRPKRSSHS